MHEVSVMASIVESVLREIEKHQVSKVEEVELILGELTRLGREQMEFAFEIVSKGTILEGSSLSIIEEPIEIRCPNCSFEGPAGRLEDDGFSHNIPVLSCPDCSKPVEVIKGKSCMVKSLKVLE